MASEEAIGLFEDGDFSGSQRLFQSLLDESQDEQVRDICRFNIASCLASQGHIRKAYEILSNLTSTGTDIIYNKAHCEYQLGNFDKVLKLTSQIIKDIIDKHPEYSIDGTSVSISSDVYESAEKRSRLENSHLIETVNLRSAAILKLEKSPSSSKQCLDQLNCKDDRVLDCTLLHNYSLYEASYSRDEFFRRMLFLVNLYTEESNKQVPRQTFSNIITMFLICNRVTELMNFIETYKESLNTQISPEFLEYVSEITNAGHSGATLLRNLEQLLERILNKLNELDASVGTVAHGDMKRLSMVVFTHCASIRWQSNQYRALEKLCEKIKSYLSSDDEVVMETCAFSVFMQDTRFDKSIDLFEEFLARTPDSSLLSADPYLLGNLCVSYLLTGRNSDAEALIKDIEAEELQDVTELSNPSVQELRASGNVGPNMKVPRHLSVINVIIGTLYCVKYNVEFGLTRVCKSVEPIEQKLDPKLWTHIKRCILSILDSHCKQRIWLNDDLLEQIVRFLINCESHGHNINLHPVESDNYSDQDANHELSTVATEARYLRSIILPIIHN